MRGLQVSAALCAAVSATTANAQTPSPPTEGLEEIVVTAERREARLQDVPISITALTAETLERSGTTSVGEVFDLAPNVGRTAGPAGGDDGGFFIRGIGQLDNSVAVDPGVGVYIDEVYIGRLQASSFDLLDVERIEVLRGPQGNLFGRNTVGGAVVITTADPSREFGAQVRLTTGSRDRIDVAGSVSVPLAESTGIRLSAFSRSQDGLGRSVYYAGETYGKIRDVGGRFKLVTRPTEGLKVTFSADYTRGRGSQGHNILLGFNPRAGVTVPRPPQFGGPFFLPGVGPTGVAFPVGVANDVSADRYLNFSSARPFQNNNNGGLSVKVVGDLTPDIQLRVISAYRSYKENQNNDFDGTGFVFYDNTNRLKQSQFSNELQLAGTVFDQRLDFLIGGYFYGEQIFNEIILCTGSNRGRLVPGCLKSANTIDLDVESVAIFGNANFKLTDTLTLTGGLRVTEETKRQNNTSTLDNRDGLPTPLAPIAMPLPGTQRVVIPFTQVQQTFNASTPKFGVNWKPTRDIMIYGSYAQGFKSGGFTGRPSNAQIRRYNPETVDTYEVGVKTELFDRKLRLNAAAFTSDYKDIQLLVFTATNGLFETANAGDARIRGFEVEADARVGPLDLRATLGYIDAGYTRLAPDAANITLATPLPLTSKWSYTLSGQYNLPLGTNRGSLALRADWNWRSTFSYQIEADPLEVQPDYGLLNLRATYAFPGDAARISVFGTNITNTVYLTNAQDARSGNGVAFGGPGAPREWGAELVLKF